MSYFIKYPDVITGAVVLTTEEPPAKLVPKIGGEIEQVYFEDNALIEKGQVVAEIKNPLSEEAVVSS